MKIPAIKLLVENASLQELKNAEEAICDEKPCDIEVLGDDEGEQLTHILAATYIKEQMEQEGKDFKTALREYTKKVRDSISC